MSNDPQEKDVYSMPQQPNTSQSSGYGSSQSYASCGGYGQGSAQQRPPAQEIRVVCTPRGEGCVPGCFKITASFCSWFFMFLFFVALIYVFRSGELNSVNEKHFSGKEGSPNKIAIITISGIIVGEDDGNFIKQLKAAENDENVKAVVLRINSPGGTVSGSDYYHYKLTEFKKSKSVPMIVSMGNMATSGGYYLAVTGDEIFAEHSTVTGSIGVIMPNYDLSGLCDKIGVKSDPIASGPLKELGSVTRTLRPEERQVLEGLVTDMFTRFKQIVREGRSAFQDDPQALDEIATGQVFTAQQAVENKLIDKIGFLDQAVERVADLAHLQPGQYEAVRYVIPKTAFEMMLGEHVEKSFQSSSAQSVIATELIREITTPRMYYIYPHALPIGTPRE